MTLPLEEVVSGPCGVWPIDPLCCPGWPEDPADWTPRHRIAVEIATEIVWRRTAGRYGLCAELIRPCRAPCDQDGYGTGFLWDLPQRWGGGWSILSPYQDDRGRWFNMLCGCGDDCGCTELCKVMLPGKVWQVLEVKIDGVVVDPSTYVLDRRPGKDVLIRRGDDCWPLCQNLSLPNTEPDTFSILYLIGQPVPLGGVRAVSTLACEIYKQCTGASGCRLPERVKTVSREGVTYDMFDPGEWLTDGLTGLMEVDVWIHSVNPNRLRQPSAVFSLDLPRAPMANRYGYQPQEGP